MAKLSKKRKAIAEKLDTAKTYSVEEAVSLIASSLHLNSKSLSMSL